MKFRKLAVAAVLATPVFAMVGVSVHGHPIFWQAGWAALSGRGGICSVSQSLRGYFDSVQQNRLWAELNASIRLRAEEGGLKLWATPDGDYWTPKDTDLRFVLAEQIRDIYSSDGVTVRPGDVVLDCGANVGTFTKKALSKGARLVVAIEPSPANVAALKRTFAKEVEQGKVIIYPKGVWDKDDTLSMFVYQNSALDSFILGARWEEKGKPVEVKLPLTTIDSSQPSFSSIASTSSRWMLREPNARRSPAAAL
jgi:FkbM family methyltransferase